MVVQQRALFLRFSFLFNNLLLFFLVDASNKSSVPNFKCFNSGIFAAAAAAAAAAAVCAEDDTAAEVVSALMSRNDLSY